MQTAAESAWRSILGGLTAPTPLWMDRGPGWTTGRARSQSALPPDAHRRLQGLAANGGPSPRGALEGVWAILLSLYAREADVLFGGVVASDTILPLRAAIDSQVPLAEWIVSAERNWQRARTLPVAPLESVQGWSEMPASAPLFESVVSVTDDDTVSANSALDRFALTLKCSLAGGRLQLDFDAGRFDPWVADRVVAHFRLGLEALLASPGIRVGEIDFLSQEERQQVLVAWNQTGSDHRAEATIADLFADQVAQRPDAPAVLDGERSASYAEVDRLSNQLAHALQRLGVAPDVAVAVCLERSIDTVVALLGILKAGGAYLALEPSYPKERMAFMLADAGAPVVLAHSSLEALLPRTAAQVLCLDRLRDRLARESVDRPKSQATARNLAYIAYTSGSTGEPKGAEITHRAVNRLVCDVDYVELGPGHTLLHAAPLAFDASTLEIWGALLTGGRCALYPEPVPTAQGLATAIRRHGVTTAWLTSALFNAIVDEDPASLRGLRQLLTGGEALSAAHVRRAQEALPDVQLFNGYGPTECTTFTTVHRIPSPFDPEARSVPIGRPIRDTSVYVLSDLRRPVPVGVAGELYVGGKGLARGYRKRPELTAERFVADPLHSGERLYRTGDIVRWRPDGTIDYLGRADEQLKIRGFRIEPGEIESVLSRHPAIQACVVTARPTADGGKRLVAYGVPTQAGMAPNASALRDWLGEHLPEYMIPSAFVWQGALPVTANGKVDLRALPEPAADRPQLRVEYVAPRSPLETTLCEVFAEQLGLSSVGVLDNFFELGGNSLLALRALSRLRQQGRDLPAVRFFQYPTVEGLARVLTSGGEEPLRARLQEEARRRAPSTAEPVAIVGFAGRFPGAMNVDELWRNLLEGRDSITRFTPAELDPSIDPTLRNDPAYVPARGVLADVECFDAPFFGINPKEAELMDPQQRLFLEACWEALESAGCVPEMHPGHIGVFAGMYNATYYQKHVVTRPDLVARVGEFQVMVANEKDYIATRVAHKLSLTGPALSIHTACSTSLVATCQAFDSLRNHQCDVALAGGSSVTCPPRSGYLYQEGAMLSPDGQTRTFDASASGTVFSDGVAVVVLQRLSDAIREGRTIYGVILGAAVNNDGGNRASFTAPSVEGQASVIAAAHAVADIDPRTISYVETHGTATPLGDPIEIEALTQAFRARTSDRGFCSVGSVKSNVGHLVIAAGATGLIKTALALTHRVIPASLHYRAPNPKIDFASSPFYVASERREWVSENAPRRAGVSAFGVGGTNAHMVVEEPPEPEATGPAREHQLLVLSARTPEALERGTARLADHLESHQELALADVAYTLQAGRKAFAHRRAVVARNAGEAVARLRGGDPRAAGVTRKAPPHSPPVAFMFPGQGSQYVGMGASLYREESVFRGEVDRCAGILSPVLGFDLRERLYPSAGAEGASAEALKETSLTQPALFTVEYALARQWMHWGVVPEAMIGHSVGEFVCAALAGVLTLEDAVRLVGERGRLMQRQPEGAMLSVRLSAQALEPRLAAGLSIASENGPALCVASGPKEAIARLQVELEAEGTVCRALQTSHAFHSPMMDPAVEAFAEVVKGVRLSAPCIPFVSTATGTWIRAEEATDPLYWARHLRETVRFASGVRALAEKPDRVLLEVGPRATLTTLARQQGFDRGRIAAASLPDNSDTDAEWTAVLAAAGQLWTAGARIDWESLQDQGRRRRVALPTYSFERLRFWIDPARPATPAGPDREVPPDARRGAGAPPRGDHTAHDRHSHVFSVPDAAAEGTTRPPAGPLARGSVGNRSPAGGG